MNQWKLLNRLAFLRLITVPQRTQKQVALLLGHEINHR